MTHWFTNHYNDIIVNFILNPLCESVKFVKFICSLRLALDLNEIHSITMDFWSGHDAIERGREDDMQTCSVFGVDGGLLFWWQSQNRNFLQQFSIGSNEWQWRMANGAILLISWTKSFPKIESYNFRRRPPRLWFFSSILFKMNRKNRSKDSFAPDRMACAVCGVQRSLYLVCRNSIK